MQPSATGLSNVETVESGQPCFVDFAGADIRRRPEWPCPAARHRCIFRHPRTATTKFSASPGRASVQFTPISSALSVSTYMRPCATTGAM